MTISDVGVTGGKKPADRWVRPGVWHGQEITEGRGRGREFLHTIGGGFYLEVVLPPLLRNTCR